MPGGGLTRLEVAVEDAEGVQVRHAARRAQGHVDDVAPRQVQRGVVQHAVQRPCPPPPRVHPKLDPPQYSFLWCMTALSGPFFRPHGGSGHVLCGLHSSRKHFTHETQSMALQRGMLQG